MKKTIAEYLREASELFDAGEVVGAGQIWQAILKRDNSINEAKAGLLKVRERLSVTSPQSQSSGSHPLPDIVSEDIESFLQEGCSLYDTGALHEALNAWEKVLAIDPGHPHALSYVRGVRKELGLAMLDTGTLITSDQAQASRPQELKLLLERGSQLYETGMFEDALDSWESALALDPDNTLTKGYLAMVQMDMKARSPTAPLPPLDELIQDSVESEVVPVEKIEQKPVSIESDNKPLINSPFSPSKQTPQTQIPWIITQVPDLNWQNNEMIEKNKTSSSSLNRPRLLRIFIAMIVMSAIGTAWFRSVKKDSILNAMQTAIREEAIKNAEQSNNPENLTLTPAELKSQAKAAIRDNPLRAYLLAQEVINRDTLDTAAARLLEQAQQAMTALPSSLNPGASFYRLMTAGNLEAAEALLEAKLRQSPNDMRTREDLARVSLLIVRSFVKQEKWDAARSRLLMGAALFPHDPTWQARLRFLNHLQSVPKEEQLRWIDLLG